MDFKDVEIYTSNIYWFFWVSNCNGFYEALINTFFNRYSPNYIHNCHVTTEQSKTKQMNIAVLSYILQNTLPPIAFFVKKIKNQPEKKLFSNNQQQILALCFLEYNDYLWTIEFAGEEYLEDHC